MRCLPDWSHRLAKPATAACPALLLCVSRSFCSALFDACPCLAAMKVRPRSVGRRWTKLNICRPVIYNVSLIFR